MIARGGPIPAPGRDPNPPRGTTVGSSLTVTRARRAPYFSTWPRTDQARHHAGVPTLRAWALSVLLVAVVSGLGLAVLVLVTG